MGLLNRVQQSNEFICLIADLPRQIWVTPSVAVPTGVEYASSLYVNCCGLYYMTGDKSSGSPNFPVYKHFDEDRYIYKHPSSEGWRIGKKEHLSGKSYGSHWFKGTH